MYFYIMSKISLITALCCVIFFFLKEPLTAQELTSQELIQPPYLKAGDIVAIVAPSGVLKNRADEIAHAKKLLNQWGLEVQVGKHVFSQANHFAGTDDERCDDLQKALDDPEIKAIWCARGGYGAVRILDKLNWEKFKQNPKWIVGYSDITALHNQIHNEGIESIHALMCTSLPNEISSIKETILTFKNAILGEPLSYKLKGSTYVTNHARF